MVDGTERCGRWALFRKGSCGGHSSAMANTWIRTCGRFSMRTGVSLSTSGKDRSSSSRPMETAKAVSIAVDLPPGARLYVGVVIVAGLALLTASVPRGAWADPRWLIALIAVSIVAHTLKVDLAAGSSPSTLSIGYVVNFASMLAFGPAPSVCVAMAGGWAQCTLRAKSPNPWYRTGFSMAVLAISIEAAAQTLRLSGGHDLSASAEIVIPALVASALVYFLVNTTLVAWALGLSTD